jgi:DNA repair exonuclease SbcCD ATPase subunit
MDAKRLKLQNFWSHKETAIDFKEPFYMILGSISGKFKSNGSGKSTIARGICYALYGNQSEEINNDSVIHNDEEKMQVEFEFELNGKDYIIKRSLKKGGSPVLKITKDGTEKKVSLKDGQKIIDDLLGADFDIFRNTSYFKQGDLNSFSSLTPKEAKEVLINILQLSNYNKYEDLAKQMLKKVNDSLTDVDFKMQSFERDLTYHENNRVAPVKELKAEKAKLKEDLKDLEFKKKLAQDMVARKEKAVQVFENKIALIDKEKNELGFTINANNKRMQKLKGLSGTCPTCEHEINQEDIDAIIKAIKKEHDPIVAKLQKLEKLLEKTYEERSEILLIVIDEENYDYQIMELNRAISAVEVDIKNSEKEENVIENLKAEIAICKEAKSKKEALKSQYEKLSAAFGKKGIQAHIIDSVIPEIQATTNDILHGLDTNIRMSIDSQKGLKKGGKAETLDISVITEYGQRPYLNYSGGEKTLIDFALRIALSIILTRRSNCQIQTLILDEVFGELDSQNKKIISKALRFIANRFNFKKILIISHAEELQDSFENVIRVEFNGKESVIKKETKVNERNHQHV